MHIDRNIANRALGACGEAELEDDDFYSRAYLLIKKYYLNTMLECLEHVVWFSGKRRARLENSDIENLTDYASAYTLPIDCAKIIDLKDKSFYLVEGNILYTDGEPILIYITNGKISDEAVEAKKKSYEDKGLEFTEEFPDYDPPEYEAHFYKAFILNLAAKLVLELSGKAELHNMLLNEALMAEEVGYQNTKAQGAGKQKGNEWWT